MWWRLWEQKADRTGQQTGPKGAATTPESTCHGPAVAKWINRLSPKKVRGSNFRSASHFGDRRQLVVTLFVTAPDLINSYVAIQVERS